MCNICQSKLLEASDSDNWDEAKHEWVHKITIAGDYGYDKCICGHSIKYKCNVVNKHNNKLFILGSRCILNFKLFNKDMVETVKDSFKTHCKYCDKTVKCIEAHELTVKHLLNVDEYEVKQKFIKCQCCNDYRIKRPSTYKVCYMCNKKNYRNCTDCGKRNIKKDSNFTLCFHCNKKKYTNIIWKN